MGQKWDDVVFSDDNFFNLDGPDGFKFYWRNLRKQPEIFSRRQMGGAMSWSGLPSVAKVSLLW
uniref:Uncharacterized protein n=1 Tax=Globisporangium ultimum (strain ATCC 200006 / CBS 805.95 / DAOM BR144) TaxID=431595 RepID=K3WWM0_GLOUD